MRVAREVSLEKFDGEVAILREQESFLRQSGCYLVRVSFPEIDALIVPTRHLATALPLGAPSAPGGQPTLQMLPLQNALTAMPFGVRLSLDDFDLRAPSVTFRHPSSWEILPHEHLPQGVHIVDGKPIRVVHAKHPTTEFPFFCMRGVREYHEHPQHSGDEWLLYRGSINSFSILSCIIRCCCTNVSPVILLLPQFQLQSRVDWTL